MSTFEQVVDDTLAYLRSYVRDQELSTHLTVNATNSDTVLTVNDGGVISRGRVEIGDELIWVDSVDRAAGQVTVPPYGRGMDGTTAAVHAAGSRVIVSPLYPRSMVKTEINRVILSMRGVLFGVAHVDAPGSFTSPVYEVPSSAMHVLNVSTSYEWSSGANATFLRRWKFDPNVDTTVSSTGKAVLVYDPISTQDTVRVTYATDPVALEDGDDFTASGLSESAQDLVVLGAAAKLLPSAAVRRLATQSAEASLLDSRSDSNAAVQQASYLQARFRERVAEERARLLSTFANRSHFQG